MKGTTWIGALALAGVLAVAGCGGSGNSSGGGGSAGGGGSGSSGSKKAASSASGGGSGKLSLAADPSGQLEFDKKTLTAKAGTVTIAFTNQSSVPHAVAVEGHGVDKDGATITKGSNTLTVKLKPGRYEFYCPVDGHRQAGMEGTLTVK